ncbi:hypothetical protein Fmac_018927 [Flemingia macrophylla]|uniref:Choline transporter-like protein n=1 Tax=Flemingia macrophylla TaxID=520843 RepID=A0ABD1M6G2_9FABA
MSATLTAVYMTSCRKKVICDRCCGYSIHYTLHIGAAILFLLFCCYNLGSVALGSLTVSFVESIRFLVESIRRKLKVSSHVPDSWIAKAVYQSSQYFQRCLEWTIKSVNRNAYIMIALTGKSFYKASAVSIELIMSNILRIGRVNVIGDVILFLGKLCVSLSSAVFAFLMLDAHKYKSAHKIPSPLLPVVACWGLGYIVATLFFTVVEMSIDPSFSHSAKTLKSMGRHKLLDIKNFVKKVGNEGGGLKMAKNGEKWVLGQVMAPRGQFDAPASREVEIWLPSNKEDRVLALRRYRLLENGVFQLVEMPTLVLQWHAKTFELGLKWTSIIAVNELGLQRQL